jgi:phosphatidylserine/phosphatidylglycerophosphate/cardiolipin synthase-like enzyme
VSRWPAADAAREDDAAWASRIVEQLPAADARHLARAAADGPAAVRVLRAQAGAAVLRNACDQLLGRLPEEGSSYLAGLLAGAARAFERARRRQHLDVVWTGPETGGGAGRLTAATVAGLIGQAHREILIVSYATHSEPAIEAALAEAAGRRVEITILAERHEDNPGYAASGPPLPGLRAIRLRWPANLRPAGAALHAKIIVVDDRIALVGSANFTSRAMGSNLECGILISGGPEPRAIRDYITELQARGYLMRSPA